MKRGWDLPSGPAGNISALAHRIRASAAMHLMHTTRIRPEHGPLAPPPACEPREMVLALVLDARGRVCNAHHPETPGSQEMELDTTLALRRPECRDPSFATPTAALAGKNNGEAQRK